ncbi:MAG: tyrosine protein kinase [Proteobacteria bacterium]|nr:MAG: tyrosine protein kinase [Pseudomonadota bacterium]PIE67459.1 MAG: tyrosine protein kinase [Deltaproteobacteria bacterium]
MKLQKALDKAKQNRKQDDVRVGPAPQPVTKERPSEARWAAPVYSTSTQVPIDTQVLKANRCICIESGGPEMESYKVLRAKIQHRALENNWRTVMVTSPSPGDGKTLTAVNLALTMARAYDQTVLLADCDLKRQSLHKILGIDSHMGLQDYLVNGTPLEKIIIWPGVEKMSLISGGEPAINSAEILASPQMNDLVEELKIRYDDRIVLFDTPPVLSGADTLALAPLVDCIVMVVSEGKTSMKDVKKAIDVIPPDKLLGFVINRQRFDAAKVYYG